MRSLFVLEFFLFDSIVLRSMYKGMCLGSHVVILSKFESDNCTNGICLSFLGGKLPKFRK